jgi:hypothetical protein
MNPITIYRTPDAWTIANAGTFGSLDAAMIDAEKLAKVECGPVQMDVANCNPTTLEFDPQAKPFVVGWYRDGELIRETAL